MLQRALLAGAVIGGSVLGYRWWKREQEKKQAGKVNGVLTAVGLDALVAPGPKVRKGVFTPARITASKVRKGAKFAPARITASKVRKGLSPMRITASKVRTGAKPVAMVRPMTLSECCDNLCLPTLKRTTRPGPVLDQNVNFMRNIIESNDPYTYC